MKLSVAMKVILGFSLITALLLFSGVSSLISLKTVQSSQQQLIETAEPILDNTEMLRLELALSRESLLEAYYQAKLSDLSERRQDFSRSQQQLSQTLQELQNKIRKAPQFSATLNQVTPLIAHYQKTASQLLDFQESHLNAKQGAIKSLEILSEAVDDASSLLLDLADVAESSELVAEQQLVDLANETEGRAMSLLTASQDLMTMTELEQLEVASNTLNFLAQAIRKNIQTLSQQLTTFSEPDYLKEANAGLSHLLSLIKGPQSTLELHRKTLQQKIQATQLQQQISVDSDALTQQLSELNQQLFKFSQAAQQQVEDEVSRGSLVNWVVMSLSVIITILIAFFVVRSIVKPLQEVNDILHVVASGDLGQRLTYNKQDEFGTLANNVNILIDNLRQLIQSIIERSTQLGTAAEQTSAVTVQSTQSIQQQKQRIEQVATATTEMNSTSQQVVESANDTLTAIKHADDEAEHVKELAASTRNTMVSLAEEVKIASRVIDQLHEDSTSIGSILDVIRGVAEQTNLLALNAAIEAARAGEQGRGFAVVADEVRSLASRTQESTQEINTMIEKLQEGALQAVTVMSQGQQMAESCVKQVEDSTNALGVITDSVHHAHDISTQINQAALEQTQVTGQISQQLEQIVLIAEETTQGASQTADASQQVAGLSEELRSSIERFKV